jgi:hypothetical protein
MNLEDQNWLETWRLKAIATSVGEELQRRNGPAPFYPVDEVQAACDARNVTGHSRGCALAMFVEAGSLGHLLQDLGISDPAEELRKMMAQKLSGWDLDIDCSTFDFNYIDAGPSHDSGGSPSHGDGGSGGDGGDG